MRSYSDAKAIVCRHLRTWWLSEPSGPAWEWEWFAAGQELWWVHSHFDWKKKLVRQLKRKSTPLGSVVDPHQDDADTDPFNVMCLTNHWPIDPAAVLEKEIRDILVRIRIWLMDPDPTPFLSDFKDGKKKFSYNFPAGTLSSVLIFC